MPEESIRKILIIQTAFLGDLILTIPLIKGVRLKFPSAEITVLVRKGLGELIKGLKVVNSVIEYDKLSSERGFLKTLALVKTLRSKGFDLLISPHRSLRTSLIVYFSNIPVRVGFKESTLSFVYNKIVSRNLSDHEIIRNLSLLNPLNGKNIDISRTLDLDIDHQVLEKAWQILLKHGVSKGDRIISVAPGSHWGTKRWLPERFAGVINKLDEDGFKIILIGSREDRVITEDIKRRSKRELVDLCGETSILESAAIISISEALLSNDSAAVHLATLTCTPVAVIYGPTLPSFGFTPYKVSSAIIEYNGLHCRPCSSHGPMHCPEGHFNCMRMITEEDVYNALKKLLAKKDAKRI